METRKVSAHYVFPGHTQALKFGIVEFNSDGTILDLKDPGGKFMETEGMEFYSGILTPGFIISPFLKDLSDMNHDIPEFPFISEFFNWLGDMRKVRIAEDVSESMKILKYMTILQERNPSMSLTELIARVTYDAACSLGIEEKCGSLRPDRKPGINLLANLDLQKMKLTEETQVVRIL